MESKHGFDGNDGYSEETKLWLFTDLKLLTSMPRLQEREMYSVIYSTRVPHGWSGSPGAIDQL